MQLHFDKSISKANLGDVRLTLSKIETKSIILIKHTMKKMTCKELGGACDHEFKAETFDELQEQVKAHGGEMFMKQDAPHMEAIQKMMAMMSNPEEMNKWMEEKKALFNTLPNA